MQVKHNLEQEVESMENEIDQLRAQLERGDNNDLEEVKISDEENAAGSEKIVTSFPKACESADCNQNAVEQGVVLDGVKDILTSPENVEDWPELSANTLKMCESMMMLPRDTIAVVRQQSVNVNAGIRVNEDDAGTLMNAECESGRTSGRAVDLRGQAASVISDEHAASGTASAVSLFNDSALLVSVSAAGPMASESCRHAGGVDQESLSAVPDSLDRATSVKRAALLSEDHGSIACAVSQVDVSMARQIVGESCIQSGLGQESVSAVPDSLDRTPVACENAAADDTNSYLSCEEDIVVPDSQDDLYSSPPCSLLAADEPSHAEVSYSDGREPFEDVGDGEREPRQSNDVLMNASGHELSSSEVIRRDSLAAEHRSPSGVGCGRMSERENSGTSPRNGERNEPASHVTDASSDDTVKPKSTVRADDSAEESHHQADTEELIDELVNFHSAEHLQLVASSRSIVPEQFPKRPHWKFVASGISLTLDQVMTPPFDHHHHHHHHHYHHHHQIFVKKRLTNCNRITIYRCLNACHRYL